MHFPKALAIALCLLISPQVFAHKLNVFVYSEADTVFVDGYFADGTKAKNSEVTVYNMNHDVVVEGTTNDEGEFNFPAQGTEPLRVVLNAGMGHKTEYTLNESEFELESTTTPSVEEVDTGSSNSTSTSASVNSEEIQAIVQKAVNNAVKPLAREISELKNQTTLSDIIGGFGIIIGVLGGFAYYTARKEKAKSN